MVCLLANSDLVNYKYAFEDKDLGRGVTREAIAFARNLVSSRGKPKGYLQLAGGTNVHTVDGLKKQGLFQTTSLPEESDNGLISSSSLQTTDALVGGVAFRGYARKIVGKILNTMQSQHGHDCIEEHPEHLLKALLESLSLEKGSDELFKDMGNAIN